MTETKPHSDQLTDLRRQAEDIVGEKAAQLPKNFAAHSPEEVQRAFHELQVHQIELEMQNEILRQTQVKLEAASTRYFDLYNLAPVGYCTLSEEGMILEVNLTFAALLGMAKSNLVKQPLAHFIYKEDQDIYFLYRKQLFEMGKPPACELRMVRTGIAPPPILGESCGDCRAVRFRRVCVQGCDQ